MENSDQELPTEESKKKEKNHFRKHLGLYAFVAVLTIASITFRLINQFHFEQTSLLFVGLPALITVLMIRFSKTPKSAYGVVFRTITLFLLMSSIVLGEGTVCVLFAAPLFYGVAALIVFLFNYAKKKDKDKMYSLLVIPLIILLAHPFGMKSTGEITTVSTTQTFANTIALTDLNKHPNFMLDYPAFFHVGFPKPLDIQGEGLAIGDTRDIRFESTTKGIGTLSLQIAEASNQKIVFDIAKDETHIAHWLTWKKVEVEIIPSEDQNSTTVVWTSHYTCDLGPQWYFAPLEKLTVDLMNQHLINSYFNQ